jgi:hypothetical protein
VPPLVKDYREADRFVSVCRLADHLEILFVPGAPGGCSYDSVSDCPKKRKGYFQNFSFDVMMIATGTHPQTGESIEMMRNLFILLVSTVVVVCLSGEGLAIKSIPQESGVSGFINVGAGGISGKSNMIAGNSLGDIGKREIDSLNDAPDSETDVIPVLSGELAYTFAGSRTQVFIGNSLEDFIRFETTSQVGVRQELPDKSILGVGYVFSGLPTEVWADPYVVGQNRKKTDRDSSGLRLGFDRILGSDFEIEFTWRSIDLDKERSGFTQQTLLGLSASEVRLLRREGDSYNFEILYPFRFRQGKHILAPAVAYTRFDLDGGAMANDRYQGRLTYFYTGNIVDVAANVLLAYADYDKANPIYRKKRDDTIYGGSLSVFYKNLFSVNRLSLVGTLAGFESDANIDFYDTTIGFTSLSVLYRF